MRIPQRRPVLAAVTALALAVPLAATLSPAEAGRIAAVLPLPKKRAAIAPQGFTRQHGNRLARWVGVVRRSGLDACLR